MEDLEKHAIAFVIAVLAVIAGLAVFYLLGLDQEILNLNAPKTSSRSSSSS
jgi:hypothetical protein